MKAKFNSRFSLLLALIMLLCVAVFVVACNDNGEEVPTPTVDPGGVSGADPTPSTTPPSQPTYGEHDTPFGKYGVLQIIDGQLCDSNGFPVQLRGMSSFGLQWGAGSWVLTEDAFDVLADDWECDIIRLAMYITEAGYRTNPSLILSHVELGIKLATERGMYVMVDWHILTPGDPMHEDYLTAGLDDPDMPAEFLALRDANPNWTGPQVFFAYLAQKYGSQGNILWETANEPNRIGNYNNRFETWTTRLKPYHESVIEAIRQFDEKGIIICGTDSWSQLIDAPVNDPIDDPHVMYAMHFYAGTHDTGNDNWIRGMVDNALSHGLAVFCTEWGTSEASGDKGPYIDYSIRWMEFLADRKISWCAWSLAQKNEVSSAFTASVTSNPQGAWPDDQVTDSGRFYRAMIKGDPVPMYPGPPEHNGDISRRPVADKGEFSLFTFEDGTLEGWSRDDTSKVQNSDITVGVAESNALMFPMTFVPGEDAWEQGARLGTMFFTDQEMPLSRSRDITAFTMEIFLDVDAATDGYLQIAVIPVPDGAGWWYEAGRVDIDPINGGEVITTADGRQLRKYVIDLPFTIQDYSSPVRVRNIILALFNWGETDYSGTVYYDNIGFKFS
ncbi:MAG: glycoside hydrolase family 5 protein [Oscillospiraceae bacterium]|nr:glycoside hydrolase family 5 protein [Oscillospiraceae bacterium]